VLDPAATPDVVAAFDVDGTLTVRDCVAPFLRDVAGARLAWAFLRRPATTLVALARRDNDALKALACAALEGMPAAEIERRGAAHARRIRGSWMRVDTLARLDRHRALGHRVVLVSASLAPYLDPLGALLGVDGVLCTRLEEAPDGRLTGSLLGPNCRGPEKVVRLERWLAQEGLGHIELWAYGDSRGDRELLARADRPHLVGSGPLAAEV
jgi:phosphatidylglycerophosphatase C